MKNYFTTDVIRFVSENSPNILTNPKNDLGRGGGVVLQINTSKGINSVVIFFNDIAFVCTINCKFFTFTVAYCFVIFIDACNF